MGFELMLTSDAEHSGRTASDQVTGILGMLATKMNIELAVLDAQQWNEYEGVQKVVSGDNGRMIIVITSCNPAAITAPIPSFFHGFPVSFCEMTHSSPDLES